MQFKDAAYEILKESGKPLHYGEITDLAIKKGILHTAGLTPHASMGALLYTDTLKENSRFKRGDEKGTFLLQIPSPKGIKQQMNLSKNKFGRIYASTCLRFTRRNLKNLSALCLKKWDLMKLKPLLTATTKV